MKQKKVVFPDNVPKKLIRLYKHYKGSVRAIEKNRGVNTYYICKLINNGIEPTDKTEHGQSIRVKLFLPRLKKKIKVQSDKPKKIKPDYIVTWDHLPTEERHQVIKEYLKWKKKDLEN